MPNDVITTVEEYQAAIMRLAVLGETAAEGPEEDEFLAISAAMVAYETRRRPVLEGEVTDERGPESDRTLAPRL